MKNTNTKSEYQIKNIAWKYFISKGLAPKDHSGWCLHHKDINLKSSDPVRYHQWRVQDLIPMLVEDHRSYHMHLQQIHHHQSKSHRANISKGMKNSEIKNKKIMISLTTSVIFDTITEAASYIGCSKQLVSQCLRPNRTNKKAKGYKITLV